jgi:hypothetical protein
MRRQVLALGLSLLVCPILACGDMGDPAPDPAATSEHQAAFTGGVIRDTNFVPPPSVLRVTVPFEPVDIGDHGKPWPRAGTSVPFEPIDPGDHGQPWPRGGSTVPFVPIDPGDHAQPWPRGGSSDMGANDPQHKGPPPPPCVSCPWGFDFPDEVVIGVPRLPAGSGVVTGRDDKRPPPPPCITCPPERPGTPLEEILVPR